MSPNDPPTDSKSAREAALAEALRANLRRRKAAASPPPPQPAKNNEPS
jgi:hypothetical protein